MKKEIIDILSLIYNTTPEEADLITLYNAVSKAGMNEIYPLWKKQSSQIRKRACYLSAEFLTGRMIYSNLYNMKMLSECEEVLKEHGISPEIFEDIEDNALGNGGLGRLAACFLDSAATHEIPLDGYGIRYRYGLFKQYFENGFQCEKEDDWTKYGDPWSIRREEFTQKVKFGDQTVLAVPYDMPVIGYGGKMINTLRLWQAEPVEKFNFELFNDQKYEEAFRERNRAEMISSVLYPNDNGYEGKALRLRQQYFFASASIKNMIHEFVKEYDTDFSKFPELYAIQLNDTHPIIAIPEFMRILISTYHMSVTDSIEIARKTFAYTNHTVMAEAMEKWDVNLFRDILPDVYPYVIILNNKLMQTLSNSATNDSDKEKYKIISGNQIHMANIGVFGSHSVNGVAKLHTDILRKDVLKQWFELYPERFSNKTNGITQRRWLALSNKELASFITDKIGDNWLYDLEELKKLEKYADDKNVLDEFTKIKDIKKRELCDYIKANEDISLDPKFIFDIQIKRLHEYKRQLLNILSIIDIYFSIKDGSLKEFSPTVFLFGAKAAPGYYRAKGIIKLINEAADLINSDSSVNEIIKVLFVQNYNVSYAQKLIPAADISEQISTAGTEASGTGNMKLMLNGAVTLGTLDGANIEIVNEAGIENNYIFGADADEISHIAKDYDPMKIYNENSHVKRALDSLVNGTFSDGGTGMFRELYDSILHGSDWHKADHYFLLYDFDSYTKTRLKANSDYKDKYLFAKKCFINMCNAGKFSSDRTVKEYAEHIWDLTDI